MELPDTFAAIDIETTGLGNWDRIIEVAVVKCHCRKVIKKYHTLVYTEKKISEKAREVNGISQGMLEDKPQIWEALITVKKIVGNTPLIAHNAIFDKKFITRAAKGCRIPFENNWIDTVPIARKLLPGLESYKLEVIANALCLEGHYHRALDDAMMTAKIYMDFLEMADEEF
ncbi:MAG: 3'-5' exonuclease [Chromatiales bacterium]|nr:3'-5' exonuclease [Chromatiales bacterium]